jgi:glycosyltransferase involved in cell wall biosynthesis
VRILIVGRHHGAQIRGATVAVHGLARALAGRGHAVTLLQSARPEHRLALDGVTMRYRATLRKSLYPLLFAAVRRGEFDAVHTNDESGAFFALRSRFRALPLAAQLQPPVVHRESFWHAGWRWRYIGLAARYAPVVVTPSEWLARELAARYARAPACFRVVPYGIGEHWFAARREPPAAERGPLRVALVNMKGVPLALRAFAGLAAGSDAQLELYGAHGQEAQLRELATQIGVATQVRFAGFVPNAELPARLAGADLLLHPTESESFGQVLAEAAALGIPAISSRVNAVPEVVEEGVTGLLCPVGDVEAFAAALGRLAADRPLRLALGRAARERAEQRWRWGAVAERLEREVYEPLVARRTRAATLPGHGTWT